VVSEYEYKVNERKSWLQMKKSIILIRHGESCNNIIYDEIRRTHGADVSADILEAEEERMRTPDPGLSERGKKQSRRLGEWIRSKGGVDKAMMGPIVQGVGAWEIYSSPMQRALMTAREMVVAMDQPELIVRVHPELYESGGCYNRDGGISGLGKNEIETTYPGFTCDSGMEEGWYRKSNMETSKEFMERMDRLATWVRAQRHNTVLVIHGNLISGLINRLVLGSEGNSLGNMGGLYVHCNTGFSHLQLIPEKLKTGDRDVNITAVLAVNRIDHLIGESELHSGDRPYDDHWVQEYTPLLEVENN